MTITNKEKKEICSIKNEIDFKEWINEKYPQFLFQLDKEIYTKYIHPSDLLKK